MSQGFSVATFKCLRQAGFSFVVQRLWRSTCSVDPVAVASVDAAWAAGMPHVDGRTFNKYEQEGCVETRTRPVGSSDSC